MEDARKDSDRKGLITHRQVKEARRQKYRDFRSTLKDETLFEVELIRKEGSAPVVSPSMDGHFPIILSVGSEEFTIEPFSTKTAAIKHQVWPLGGMIPQLIAVDQNFTIGQAEQSAAVPD